jgi:GTP-binding protein HflX
MKSGNERFLLVSIVPKQSSNEEIVQDMRELKELVDSYGGTVIEFVTQKRETHDKGKYIGDGKVLEVLDIVKQEKIDIVVLNGIIKPGHLFDLKRTLQKVNHAIKVWDRSDLILGIFSKHAHTAEAKLQIELAAMRHMGPRIYGMGMELSGQGGGIGTRGIGETNTELMRRHWRVQMKKTKDKLEKLARQRELQLSRRKRVGLPTVSLVGYTNVGKTSLFNVLTGKHKFADDTLFATLDTTTSKLHFNASNTDVLLSDTIGFIRNLPPTLIEAFTSTLYESIRADLLLHVIDCSDPKFEEKMAIVEETLHSLPVGTPERLYVFNKIDTRKLDSAKLAKKYEQFHPQFISVKTGVGITQLKKAIEQFLSKS